MKSKIAGLALTLACGCALASPAAGAVEVTAGSGLVQLPATSYHSLTYHAEAAFGKPVSRFVAGFGMNQPFSISGYTQDFFYGDLGWEWATPPQSGFFNLFAGAGVGFFDDLVNGSSGFVPSLTMHGGLRMGGEHLGIVLSVNAFLGIYNPMQLFYFTLWPMTSYLGGLYVAF